MQTTEVARLTLVCVSIIFVSLIFTSSSSAEIDMGTVAGLWLFDEDNGNIAKDSSPNGNDGEILGEPAWVDSVFGKALEFDGVDDHINCGSDESLNLTEAFTLMALAKYTIDGALDFLCHTDCGGYFIATWASKINFPQQCTVCIEGENLNDGEWHYIAGTWDGSTAKLYYDGELHQEKAHTEPFNNPGNLHIGCAGDRLDEFFVGTMDEVGVFNVALSADDVKEIATKGFAEVQAVSPKEKLTTVWGKIKAEN